MTLWSKTRHLLDDSITDAFQIGDYYEGVHDFRRNAIRIILIFFLFVLLANFLATKVFNPSITYHTEVRFCVSLGSVALVGPEDACPVFVQFSPLHSSSFFLLDNDPK